MELCVSAGATGGRVAQRRIRASEYVSEHRRSFAASVGFALFMLCCMLTIWGGLPLLERTGLTLLSLLAWCSIPLFATIAAALFVLAYARALPPSVALVVEVLSRPWVACALIIGSYIVLALVGSLSGEAAACAFGVLAGGGIASLLMRWELAFGALGVGEVVKVVLAALVVHSILFAVLALAPLLVLEAVFVLSTVGSTALLCFFERTGRSGAAAGEVGGCAFRTAGAEEGAVQDSGKASFRLDALFKALRNPIFCVAATVFAVAITRTMALQTVPQMVAAVGITSSIGAAVTGGVLVLVLVSPLGSGAWVRGPSITSLYRIMFPVIATALLVLSIFNGTELIVTMLLYAAFSLLFAMIMPSCLETAQSEGVEVRFAFGVFAGIVYAAFAAGALASVVLYHARVFDAPIPLIAALLVLYALSMAYAGMQRREKPQGERDAGEAATDAAGEAVAASDASLEKRCEAIVRRFELSPRESDVLVAFAHGRNVAYLAERLCLSENTIRSHSKSLYTKLGIHSKQELLDLVEEAGKGDCG